MAYKMKKLHNVAYFCVFQRVKTKKLFYYEIIYGYISNNKPIGRDKYPKDEQS